jgi:hypothetical protein
LPPAKNRSRPAARTILARISLPRPVHPWPEDLLRVVGKPAQPIVDEVAFPARATCLAFAAFALWKMPEGTATII